MWLLFVISELHLALQSSKLYGFSFRNRMGPFEYPFSGLFVQEVQLNRIGGVNVGVAKKVFSLQEQNVAF